MTSNLDITRFVYGVFAAIVLFLSASISGHIAGGHGSIKAREITITLILLLLIGIQLYYLIKVSIYVPSTKHYVFDVHSTRKDCLDSGKGGKRPQDYNTDLYLNPCYCNVFATCYIRGTKIIIPSSTCPTDGTATCFDRHGKKIGVYIPYERNCRSAVGFRCTYDEPCDPCDRSTLLTFNTSRCGACTSYNTGNCNFVPEIGPYCYQEPGSRVVVPCKKCCTEFQPIFIDDVCY